MQHKVTAQIGAHSISIETGKIAKLADGSVHLCRIADGAIVHKRIADGAVKPLETSKP